MWSLLVFFLALLRCSVETAALIINQNLLPRTRFWVRLCLKNLGPSEVFQTEH